MIELKDKTTKKSIFINTDKIISVEQTEDRNGAIVILDNFIRYVVAEDAKDIYLGINTSKIFSVS